jgi:hypothetical protein
MEELGTEKVLMDQRMGHLDGSVAAGPAGAGTDEKGK